VPSERHIGDVLVQGENWEEAIGYYEEASRYLGDMDEIKERIAKANMGMENWEESLKMEMELLNDAKKSKKRHDIAKHLLIIGNIHLRSGRYAEALKNYEEAREIIGSLGYREAMAVVENNIGSALLKLGRLKEAEEHIMNAIRSKDKGKQGFKAFSNLGYLYELKGDIEGAEKAYREAIKIGDDCDITPIIVRAMRLMTEYGKWGEAIAIGKSWEEKVPENERWRILNAMADAYEKGRMHEDAIKSRKKAVLLSNRPDISVSLAEDLIFAGKIEESLAILDKEEKRAVPWEHGLILRISELKGRAFSIKGDKERAAEYYMKAIRIAEDLGDTETAERLRAVLNGF
jgi:tetratricopeptide (TPR) repeat protein